MKRTGKIDMEKLLQQMIRTEDFCKVKNSKLADEGLPKDTIVYVAGTQVVPENKHDLYTQRIKFIVTPLVDGHIQPHGKMYLIDPVNIKKLHPSRQEELHEILVKDFGDEGEGEYGGEGAREQGELFTTH